MKNRNNEKKTKEMNKNTQVNRKLIRTKLKTKEK